jgi:hypothetical protein
MASDSDAGRERGFVSDALKASQLSIMGCDIAT